MRSFEQSAGTQIDGGGLERVGKTGLASVSTVLAIAVAVCLCAALPVEARPGFVRADGTKLIDRDGAAFRLRGIGFEWDTGYAIDSAVNDMRRAAEIGANSIRVVVPAQDVEWEDAAGIDRLDSMAKAAWRYGGRIVIALDCANADEGDTDGSTCWRNSDELDRIARAWTTVARRFREREDVVAYELMARPIFPDARSYRLFAQYLIDLIREIDEEHMLIATAPAGEADFFDNGGADPGGVERVALTDDNIAFGFSEYHPDAFTMQGSGRRPVGVSWPGTYPEDVRDAADWARRSVSGGRAKRRLKLETIAPDGSVFVAPRVYVSGAGRARFSNVRIDEVAVFERLRGGIVFADTFGSVETLWWEYPESARVAIERGEAAGEGLLVLDGAGRGRVIAQPYTTHDVSRLPAANEQMLYRVTAEVSVEGTAEAGIGLAFLKAKLIRVDSGSVEARLRRQADNARGLDAPVILMEFGATRWAPDNDAVSWDRAVIESCERNGISWHYRTFREFGRGDARPGETQFGVYRAAAEISTTKSDIWVELHELLWNTYKRSPVAAARAAEPAAPEEEYRHNVVPPPPGAACWFAAQAPDSPTQASSITTFGSVMAFARKTGKAPAWVLIYSPWKDARGRWTVFPENQFREVAAAGSIPMLAWEPRGAGGEALPASFIMGGLADTYIRAWADEARRYRDTFVIRQMRDMNAGAYLHIFGIFEERGAANVSWMWQPVISLREVAESDSLVSGIEGWPGSQAVDWIGLNVYDRPELDDTGIAIRLFPVDEVRAMVERVRRYAKPVCLAEVACENTRGQGQWWADALTQLRGEELAAVRAMVLIEGLPGGTGNGAAPDFRLNADAMHRLRAGLADPYFAGSD